MLGWSKKEICRLGRQGIVEQNPNLTEAVRNRRESGNFFGELTFIKKDGTAFPVELSSSVFKDSDGMEFTTLIIRDITERKATAEKLKASEAEYCSLFENSIMGISQTYPDGRYKRINKAYAEMYGYPDTSTMMKEVSTGAKFFSNPEDRKKVLEILDKTGYMPPTEFELNRRSGEKFWAVVSAKKVMDNDGKLLYLQADHRDITRRKKLEKEMYSSSLYARSLIEASLDPLVTINAEGKITDVNLSTEKITGITRKNLIGSDFADYFENPDKARTGYKTVFSEGMVKDYPLTILHKSGRKIDVLYNATLFKNEKGEVQGVFAAARDITELKKIEEELRKSKELLEKLNQHLVEVRENERNQIALNLHDDLGQKLTAINLDIAWLKSRIGVQSKSVREKFVEMSSMIKETVESIRETSSLLRPAILFDLGLVPAIKSQLGKFEKQTGIKCHFYFKPEEFDIEERVALILYRILQESLTNIARHSGASATEIDLVMLKNKIEMIIEDNGKGIAKDKVNSLESMGIAGMKERVKSANGKIIIRGENGAGTRIEVKIPLIKVKVDD
jgi:PAS domain S-box-containing protein